MELVNSFDLMGCVLYELLALLVQRSLGEENQEKFICGRPLESTRSGNRVWKYCCSVWYRSRNFLCVTYLLTLLVTPMYILRNRRLCHFSGL